MKSMTSFLRSPLTLFLFIMTLLGPSSASHGSSAEISPAHADLVEQFLDNLAQIESFGGSADLSILNPESDLVSEKLASLISFTSPARAKWTLNRNVCTKDQNCALEISDYELRRDASGAGVFLVNGREARVRNVTNRELEIAWTSVRREEPVEVEVRLRRTREQTLLVLESGRSLLGQGLYHSLTIATALEKAIH